MDGLSCSSGAPPETYSKHMKALLSLAPAEGCVFAMAIHHKPHPFPAWVPFTLYPRTDEILAAIIEFSANSVLERTWDGLANKSRIAREFALNAFYAAMGRARPEKISLTLSEVIRAYYGHVFAVVIRDRKPSVLVDDIYAAGYYPAHLIQRTNPDGTLGYTLPLSQRERHGLTVRYNGLYPAGLANDNWSSIYNAAFLPLSPDQYDHAPGTIVQHMQEGVYHSWGTRAPNCKHRILAALDDLGVFVPSLLRNKLPRDTARLIDRQTRRQGSPSIDGGITYIDSQAMYEAVQRVELASPSHPSVRERAAIRAAEIVR